MMLKPWSVTTTVRNPERVREFLKVLKMLEGERWDFETQEKFQILLIQQRKYGYGEPQFINSLPKEIQRNLNDFNKELSFSEAKQIFDLKHYSDPPMRGRQSFNILNKFGFASISRGERKVVITELGKLLIDEEQDVANIFLKCFIKWQIPNFLSDDYNVDDGYNIKPFVGILHLIDKVNRLEAAKGRKQKGLSKKEFNIFGPTLINYQFIERYAERIILLREKMSGKTQREQDAVFTEETTNHLQNFYLGPNTKQREMLIKDLRDYGDNAIRYFRLTSFLRLRGEGSYIDLEPLRAVEIKTMLEMDNAASCIFTTREEYQEYLIDINRPLLPWETRAEKENIFTLLVNSISELENTTGTLKRSIPKATQLSNDALQKEIEGLREYRKYLNEVVDQQSSQSIENINEYINGLEMIRTSNSPTIELERLSALCLTALDDTLKIKPNYPLGDDNNPTSTAPGNRPDIECFYEKFNAICEVTLLTNRSQWFQEGQPVMRHLRDFEVKYSDKQAFCLFIAPFLHRDTINTFWTSTKYEYEGKPQNIVPLNFKQFQTILKALVAKKEMGKNLSHYNLLDLYERIVHSVNTSTDSHSWIDTIDEHINIWKEEVLA